MPATKTPTRTPAKPPAKTPSKKPAARMSLTEAMRELEMAGSAQTRKTYARHGAVEPMFGVSSATLKALVKRMGVDHELALALWDTANYDARNLALKIADPAQMKPKDLDRWAGESRGPMCSGGVGMLAAEGPHASAMATRWLASPDVARRSAAWALLGQTTMRDETAPDAQFIERLAHVERTIHAAPSSEREAMNMAVITIGCRNAALRKAATAAAKRIGKVDIDHGDTACKTPDAAQYIEKTWAHSTSKGFESPAAHERTRELPRRRC